jgi:hypothetical protein
VIAASAGTPAIGRSRSESLPGSSVALASLVAATNPLVSSSIVIVPAAPGVTLSRTMRSACASKLALTPAEEASMRASTSRIESPAFTAIDRPLSRKEPAVTDRPGSKFGRRSRVPSNGFAGFTMLPTVLETATWNSSPSTRIPAVSASVSPLACATAVPGW